MNLRPLEPVTEDAIAAYERDGIVCLRGVFDDGGTSFRGDAVDRAMASPGEHGEEYARDGGRFFGDLDLWRGHGPFRRFVLESPAAEIAGDTASQNQG